MTWSYTMTEASPHRRNSVLLRDFSQCLMTKVHDYDVIGSFDHVYLLLLRHRCWHVRFTLHSINTTLLN
ncbi:hypothetical protein PHAVU_004G058500 [Phaseolus vulgaris]|uniref:Uncharacterized protein n=1 Tax=Phaseolus vulgaris TaxID=3885 RepID=V7C064_PHAVU|nr:hypothetical protein PHAVU_004G058500g [Phaseolus vulgaris]ESW23572.1 hypothetical protein PHAVU_004G058500g [Phaseolus vulgaris]